MTKKVQIEYIDAKGEEDYLDVVFDAEPEFDNDSYTDEYGVVVLDDYPVLNEEPTWDKGMYTKDQNKVIEKWAKDNWKELEYIFCKQLINEEKNKF